MRRRRRLGSHPNSHRVGDIPVRRRGRILPRTAGGRDVRAVQLSRDAAPARATAFGTAPAPRAPRAQVDAHPHRTLATRAKPKPPPPCRPQSATGAPCGARPHPSSPAQPSPLRPTRAPVAAHYVGHQSLPSAGNARVALAARRGPAQRRSRGAPAVDALASAPRHPAAIATWSARPARGAARGLFHATRQQTAGVGEPTGAHWERRVPVRQRSRRSCERAFIEASLVLSLTQSAAFASFIQSTPSRSGTSTSCPAGRSVLKV
jgi:hypothetical protein